MLHIQPAHMEDDKWDSLRNQVCYLCTYLSNQPCTLLFSVVTAKYKLQEQQQVAVSFVISRLQYTYSQFFVV